MFKFYISRYFSYSFVALEILLLPILFSKTEFGEIEYLKSLILLTPYILLGSFSGFVYSKYNSNIDFYNELFLGALLSSIVFSVGIFIYTGNVFLVFPSIFCSLSLIIEKKLQVENEFLISILFKPFLSIYLIIFSYLQFKYVNSKFSLGLILSFAYCLAIVSWIITTIVFTKVKILPNLKNLNSSFSKTYLFLIKKGFFINLSTILIALFLFENRFIIKKYFPLFLPAYSLGQNFSQFVFIGINTLGYVSLVKIGEEISFIKKTDLVHKIKFAIYFFLILEVVSFLLLFVYLKIVDKYYNVLYYFLISSVFIGLFYVLSVISPILLYRNKMKQSTLFLLLIFICDILTSFVLLTFNVSSIWILFKSGFLLLVTGFYNLYLIFYKIDFEENRSI